MCASAPALCLTGNSYASPFLLHASPFLHSPHTQAIFGDEYVCISPCPPVHLAVHLREPGTTEEEQMQPGGPPSRLFTLVFTLPMVRGMPHGVPHSKLLTF